VADFAPFRDAAVGFAVGAAVVVVVVIAAGGVGGVAVTRSSPDGTGAGTGAGAGATGGVALSASTSIASSSAAAAGADLRFFFAVTAAPADVPAVRAPSFFVAVVAVDSGSASSVCASASVEVPVVATRFLCGGGCTLSDASSSVVVDAVLVEASSVALRRRVDLLHRSEERIRTINQSTESNRRINHSRQSQSVVISR
jgi:hypothetical protein